MAGSLLDRIQTAPMVPPASYVRRSRAARLGWARRLRRERLQSEILQAIDELRDAGYVFSVRWPEGKPLDREHVARVLYWKLVELGTIRAESAMGYEELSDG